jgi:hypothetical protein
LIGLVYLSFFLAGRNLVEYLFFDKYPEKGYQPERLFYLKRNVKGGWVRWLAATRKGLVWWLRVAAGWAYGTYC